MSAAIRPRIRPGPAFPASCPCAAALPILLPQRPRPRIDRSWTRPAAPRRRRPAPNRGRRPRPSRASLRRHLVYRVGSHRFPRGRAIRRSGAGTHAALRHAALGPGPAFLAGWSLLANPSVRGTPPHRFSSKRQRALTRWQGASERTAPGFPPGTAVGADAPACMASRGRNRRCIEGCLRRFRSRPVTSPDLDRPDLSRGSRLPRAFALSRMGEARQEAVSDIGNVTEALEYKTYCRDERRASAGRAVHAKSSSAGSSTSPILFQLSVGAIETPGI